MKRAWCAVARTHANACAREPLVRLSWLAVVLVNLTLALFFDLYINGAIAVLFIALYLHGVLLVRQDREAP